MRELDQERAPIYEALEKFRKMRVVPLMCRDTKGEEAIRNWRHCLGKPVYRWM